MSILDGFMSILDGFMSILDGLLIVAFIVVIGLREYIFKIEYDRHGYRK